MIKQKTLCETQCQSQRWIWAAICFSSPCPFSGFLQDEATWPFTEILLLMRAAKCHMAARGLLPSQLAWKGLIPPQRCSGFPPAVCSLSCLYSLPCPVPCLVLNLTQVWIWHTHTHCSYCVQKVLLVTTSLSWCTPCSLSWCTLSSMPSRTDGFCCALWLLSSSSNSISKIFSTCCHDVQ